MRLAWLRFAAGERGGTDVRIHEVLADEIHAGKIGAQSPIPARSWAW